MKTLVCDRCGSPPKYPLGDDAISFTCGMCANFAVAIAEERQEAERMTVTPQDIKKVRKEMGMIQKDFDYYLGLPSNHTNLVENGHKLPNKDLFNFVRDKLDGKNPKVPNKKRSQKPKKRRKRRRK
jgi:hypothetical protein